MSQVSHVGIMQQCHNEIFNLLIPRIKGTASMIEFPVSNDDYQCFKLPYLGPWTTFVLKWQQWHSVC